MTVNTVYHITPVKNIPSILKYGIKSTKKKIFVVNDIETIHAIAINQVFVKEFNINPNAVVKFGLFKIDTTGLTRLISKDDVMDYTTENQFIINNINININRIEFLGEFESDIEQEKQLKAERFEKYIAFRMKGKKGRIITENGVTYFQEE